MRRSIQSAVVLLATLATLLTFALPSPAATRYAPPRPIDVEVLRAINQSRIDAGLPALKWNGRLGAIARKHSREMGALGMLFHNHTLSTRVRHWALLGENVGVGPDTATVEQNFLDSPTHHANILGGYTQIGVGVAVVDGDYWVTQVFMRPER